MSITKELLYSLVDKVDSEEYDVLFRILLKFVPTDEPTKDEVESLAIARQQVEDGEVYGQDEIDWEHLDEMNFT